jgi:hypothetical protein
MSLHDSSLRERGQVFGIAALIVGVLTAVAWFPLNLGAGALAIGLSIVAILHGERVYAVIAPVVIAAVLLFLSPLTLGVILGMAGYGNPLPLLLVLAALAAPFGVMAHDNARRGGTAGPAGAGPGLLLNRLQNLATRATGAGTRAGPQLSLIPQSTGQPITIDYRDLLRGRSITLGRMEGSDVVLRDSSVSRQHARIAVVEGLGTAICDLGSVNGTFVDGRRIGGRYVSLSGVKTIRLGECEVAVALPDGPTIAGPGR